MCIVIYYSDLSGLHSGGRDSRIPLLSLEQDSDSLPTLLDPISPDKVVHSVNANFIPPNESECVVCVYVYEKYYIHYIYTTY